MKFGAHVSISGGVYNAPLNGRESHCDVVQIFTKNQQQWRVPKLLDDDIARFKSEQVRTEVVAICVHASYLINLGGPDKRKLAMSRQGFIVEMERAETLGIPYLVVHPGSHVGAGEADGIKRIAESLDYVHDKCPDYRLKTLLETTAGQGDTLGYTFEQLAEIKERVGEKERIGFCLDTCHIFAAGYELRTEDGYQATVEKLESLLGVANVPVIHANDSKKEFGSKRDRHEHIGDGEIGLQGFGFFVNDSRWQDACMIIETPGGAEMDADNLRKLRALHINQ
jgi:deoxyribonuclease-4